jgi:hypothetical protein
MKISLKIFTLALAATAVVWLLFFIANHYLDGSAWSSLELSKSALKGEYCEFNNTAAFFHQRMDTYSNLGYFFLGTVILLSLLFEGKSEHPNLLDKFPQLSVFMGCCLVYLCFGSAFFHASLTWPGQRVDMNGTYSVCIGLSAISIYRYFDTDLSDSRKRSMLFLLIAIVIVFVKVHVMISSVFLLPSFVVLIILFTCMNYQKTRGYNLKLAVISFLLMAAAFILRTLDAKKINCNPFSYYQGHAVWHFFTGMSAFLLYWFYKTEETAHQD